MFVSSWSVLTRLLYYNPLVTLLGCLVSPCIISLNGVLSLLSVFRCYNMYFITNIAILYRPNTHFT